MSVTVVDPGFRGTGDVLCQKQGLVRAGVDKGGELGLGSAPKWKENEICFKGGGRPNGSVIIPPPPRLHWGDKHKILMIKIDSCPGPDKM